MSAEYGRGGLENSPATANPRVNRGTHIFSHRVPCSTSAMHSILPLSSISKLLESPHASKPFFFPLFSLFILPFTPPKLAFTPLLSFYHLLSSVPAFYLLTLSSFHLVYKSQKNLFLSLNQLSALPPYIYPTHLPLRATPLSPLQPHPARRIPANRLAQ